MHSIESIEEVGLKYWKCRRSRSNDKLKSCDVIFLKSSSSWYASDLQKPNKFFWDMQGSIPGPHGSESGAFTTPLSRSSLRDSDLNYLYLQVISSNSYFKRIWTNWTFVYDYLIIYSWSLYYWVCYKTYFLLICQIYYLFTYIIGEVGGTAFQRVASVNILPTISDFWINLSKMDSCTW